MTESIQKVLKSPSWILITFIGVICILLGASQQVILGNNSIQLVSPYNVIVIAVGGVFIVLGILEFRQRKTSAEEDLPIKEVILNSIDVIRMGDYPKVRVSGTVIPALQGIKVWILREHTAKLPGHYHVAAHPAFTDQNGNWQQNTNLWRGGSFRIYAVVATGNAEKLLDIYRTTFDHARNVYRNEIDKNASTFPDWPFLKSLPDRCAVDDKAITIE